MAASCTCTCGSFLYLWIFICGSALTDLATHSGGGGALSNSFKANNVHGHDSQTHDSKKCMYMCLGGPPHMETACMHGVCELGYTCTAGNIQGTQFRERAPKFGF